MRGAISERNRGIAVELLEGQRIKTVAKKFNLSPERIRQIFWHSFLQVGRKYIKEVIGFIPTFIGTVREYKDTFIPLLKLLPTCEPGQRYRTRRS